MREHARVSLAMAVYNGERFIQVDCRFRDG